MKTAVMLTASLLAAANLFAAEAPGKDNDKKAHGIIKAKCTSCHGEAKINAAFSAGKDMKKIQLEMEKRGARLSGNEQEVLGIYWKKKPQAK